MLATLLIACSDDSTGPKPIENNKTTATIFDRYSKENLGSTTLERFDNKISVKIETSNLVPGHAYILAIFTIDQPENCRSTPCGDPDWDSDREGMRIVFFKADSFIATSNFYNFSIDIPERDVTTVPLLSLPTESNFGGLQDSYKAEVNVYLRSKGPEIPGMQIEQLDSYISLCTTHYTFTDPNGKIPINEGECAWIQESIHLVRN